MSYALAAVLVAFLLLVVSPAISRGRLETKRTRAMSDFEARRGSRVISMIHRQESVSFLGLPISRHIDVDDSEAVLRAIRKTDDDVPIDLILHTPGGLVLAAEQIARALADHGATVTVHVPHYAMSGGTLLALSADRVVMDRNAVLGPVDPQLGGYPAASVLAAVERKDPNEVDDETLMLADLSEKARDQVERTVRDLLERRGVDDARAAEVAEALTDGRWTHDYPIRVSKARDLGFPVEVGVDPAVHDLMDLYAQPQGRRPAVRYVDVPYRSPGAAEEDATGGSEQA